MKLQHCRGCNHYKLNGRRGGTCQLLEVQVKGNWKACSLSVQPFRSSSCAARSEPVLAG
ncbi:hypothetical protein IQ249_05320 [Lusitaniella coriacea LEGE 07157]|uniref:Uncharacterized protein n=1 Tax=Lusitaniella coriacea LEGE 07157 TaxID=945747 RepID=A0A8J7B8D0_9CYAN|nr:hypothetical protein [Lusitaniella coriacea]MBE9115315.1 hypothetical protein [Lusitaniella coriacea LEGE 07157]